MSYVKEEFIEEAKKRNMPSPENYLVIDVVKISMGLGVSIIDPIINQSINQSIKDCFTIIPRIAIHSAVFTSSMDLISTRCC